MTKNEEHNPKLIEKAKKTKFPSPLAKKDNGMSNDEKIDYIAERFNDIMYALGLDMDDESLQRTPQRVAKMYVEEIFSGLNQSTFPAIRFVDNEYDHSKDGNMVFVKINMNSYCEHHFVPVIGTAYVAYIHKKKLIGLSKIPRIVKFFSKRPQLQERLCAQVADCLSTLLETPSVAVSVTAQHYCMIARGIEDFTSHTTTNVFRGDFESNSETRKQFFEAINRTPHGK